jgi:pimeloyl-ACP methyl ester carboxylesterase
MRILLTLVFSALLGIGGSSANAANLKDWGIVVIHGKSGPGRAVEPVAAALRKAGARVVAPAMSWIKSYRTYDATLDEVSTHVASLRSQGAKRVALVGQSIGANVALGYGARRGGIEAIVAISPGHQPDRFLRFTRDSLARAKHMVDEGHGREAAQFADVNQGRSFPIKTTAEAYVSFFDPGGPSLMRRNAADLKNVSLLWVVGSKDHAAQEIISGGTVVRVEGDHRSAGSAAARETAAWLGRL